jgi:hypothetical protein
LFRLVARRETCGPGFRFLSIIGTQQLSGKIIFVRREVGARMRSSL